MEAEELDRGRGGSFFLWRKARGFAEELVGLQFCLGSQPFFFFGWLFVTSGPRKDTALSLWLQQWGKVFLLDWKVPGKRVAV